MVISMGNGTGVVRILEQEAIETGFALATSETGNDVWSPVFGREVYRQRGLSPYPYDPQSLFLLLL